MVTTMRVPTKAMAGTAAEREMEKGLKDSTATSWSATP